MCTQIKTRARNHSNAGIQGVHPPCLDFIVAKVKMEKRKKGNEQKRKCRKNASTVSMLV